MSQKYQVNLSLEERSLLFGLIAKGEGPTRKITHARILLKADGSQPDRWTDKAISIALEISKPTVCRVRRLFAEYGLQTALNRSRLPQDLVGKLDGEKEAQLIRLACSQPPKGHARWTLRLLANMMVELNYIDAISYETVRKHLHKNELKPWKVKEWCIPPEADGEFVACMEDVLDLYTQRYNAEYPVVCMDETSKQLATAKPNSIIPVQKGKPAKEDYQFEKGESFYLFIFFEPLAGWRKITVSQRRTMKDWGRCIKDLLDNYYPNAKKVRLVLDNLNTHKPGALYETFEPQEARRLVKRLEFHYTPKHGSWLNMAEIEFSVLGRQCLDRRIGSEELLTNEVASWEASRNEEAGTVNWQFKTEDSRIHLRQLYPSFTEKTK